MEDSSWLFYKSWGIKGFHKTEMHPYNQRKDTTYTLNKFLNFHTKKIGGGVVWSPSEDVNGSFIQVAVVASPGQ